MIERRFALTSPHHCRFFLSRKDYDETVWQYDTHARLLPDRLQVHSNADGSTVDRRGFVFPPYFVLEKGVSLAMWAAEVPRGFGEVFTLVERLATLLQVRCRRCYGIKRTETCILKQACCSCTTVCPRDDLIVHSWLCNGLDGECD